LLCNWKLHSRVDWYWNWDKRQVGICNIPWKSMGKSNQSFFNQSTFIAEVISFRVMQYIRVQNFVFTMWAWWASKDAEFYVDFKNINLP
jgi:hypothetical protein